MRGGRLLAPVVILGCLFMGVRQMRSNALTSKTRSDPPIFRQQPAERLEQQGFDALANDARRRELRFQEAVNPGVGFARTRLTTAQLKELSPQRVFSLGAEIFHRRIRRREGFGARDLPALGRVHTGKRGGPDAYSCASCHRRGGTAGAGPFAANAYYEGDGNHTASALERNPPSLAGAGIIELLAREMSRELQAIRDQALDRAKTSQLAVSLQLRSKGVPFGRLRVSPNGRIDYSQLDGVDKDLVVRPFGWKGHHSSLRAMVEEQLLLHLGMQSTHLVATAPATVIGPFGGQDPDGDGIRNEVTEGQLAALTLFAALGDAPVTEMPKESYRMALWARGQKQFKQLGCAGCHTPHLHLNSSIYELKGRHGEPSISVDLAAYGAGRWLEKIPGRRGFRVYLYSDLKRHVVGPNLREQRSYRGVSAASFRTPPLWGVARSRPYLHDGRAQTLDLAIEAHSGKALAAQRAYRKLNDEERAPLRTFLMALNRSLRMVANDPQL